MDTGGQYNFHTAKRIGITANIENKSKKLTGFKAKIRRCRKRKAIVNKMLRALNGLVIKECKIN